MESSTIPLALAAAVFLAFLVWRVRPAFLEGTRKGATRDDVVRSHRSLIKKLHPDHGGSTDLAARVNEAKDVLMRRHN